MFTAGFPQINDHAATEQGGVWAPATEITHQVARKIFKDRPPFEVVEQTGEPLTEGK